MKQMKVFIYIFVTAFILSSCSIQKRCQAPELNLPDEIIAGENDTLTIADMSWWLFGCLYNFFLCNCIIFCRKFFNAVKTVIYKL